MNTKLVYGVGTNDADYTVKPRVNGKQVHCPFYQKWKDMLKRCYCPKFQAKQPTYIGCTVSSEWLVFSNFKAWMEKQDWKDKHLDKDLLVPGNKTYSRKMCVFVDSVVNKFLTDHATAKVKWSLHLSFHNENNKFRAQCCNPFTKRQETLGRFTCPDEAHEAWRARKHQLALQLADLQTDPRIANALRTRFLTKVLEAA